jgi:hypothetical protein
MTHAMILESENKEWLQTIAIYSLLLLPRLPASKPIINPSNKPTFTFFIRKPSATPIIIRNKKPILLRGCMF